MLTLEDICVTCRKKNVLSKVKIEVKKGEILGVIGPKDSGKSALCKIAAGLWIPDSGQVLWDGKPLVRKKELEIKIGYLPEKIELYKYQTVLEYLVFFGQLYGMRGREAVKEAHQILNDIDLTETANADLRSLSKGQIQKLGIGRCLLQKPDVMILDEIFNGLDPIASLEIQSLLTKLKNEGISILFTSTSLGKTSKICNRIAIMDSGSIAAIGTIDEIQHMKQSLNPIMIQVQSSVEEAVALLRKNPLVASISRKDQLISVRFQGETGEEADLLKELIDSHVIVSAFYREESDFESLFLRITNG